LRELVREFRESVGLAVLFDNHIEVVYVIESPEVVRMGNTVGRIIPPHASALGKCIAAFQSEERQEQLLRSYGLVRFTPNTIVDERQLHEEFTRIVSQGYAVDAEESTLHGYCFAAPIRAPHGEVIGAISISPPVVRLAQHDRQAMIKRVVAAAATISETLGRTGRPSPTSSRRH
jgi:IclR family acetate operon transcriptional repressor